MKKGTMSQHRQRRIDAQRRLGTAIATPCRGLRASIALSATGGRAALACATRSFAVALSPADAVPSVIPAPEKSAPTAQCLRSTLRPAASACTDYARTTGAQSEYGFRPYASAAALLTSASGFAGRLPGAAAALAVCRLIRAVDNGDSQPTNTDGYRRRSPMPASFCHEASIAACTPPAPSDDTGGASAPPPPPAPREGRRLRQPRTAIAASLRALPADVNAAPASAGGRFAIHRRLQPYSHGSDARHNTVNGRNITTSGHVNQQQ